MIHRGGRKGLEPSLYGDFDDTLREILGRGALFMATPSLDRDLDLVFGAVDRDSNVVGDRVKHRVTDLITESQSHRVKHKVTESQSQSQSHRVNHRVTESQSEAQSHTVNHRVTESQSEPQSRTPSHSPSLSSLPPLPSPRLSSFFCCCWGAHLRSRSFHLGKMAVFDKTDSLLLQSSFSPIGGCLVIHFSLSL